MDTKTFFRKRSIRIISHIGFWIFIVGFFTFIFGIRKGEFFTIFKVLLGTLPIDILFTYFILYWLIPKYLLTRRYIVFSAWLLISFTIIVIIEWTVNFYIMYPAMYPDWDLWKSKMHYLSWDAVSLYLSIGFVVLFASSIKLFRYYFQSQQSQAELEIQNRKSELALLRSQVNPHFLFNTLNNIDALIRKDPDKASDSILKLSGIMRYFIYEANTEKVPLIKEVDYLNNFIELQRIRYKNPDYIRYVVTGSPEGIDIAPMLFVPFVENAFKHGTRRQSVPGISIELEMQPEKLRLEVWNFAEKNGNGTKDPGQGIGLVNVEKRLKLIYPGKHQLTITEDEEKYQVTLIIWLR